MVGSVSSMLFSQGPQTRRSWILCPREGAHALQQGLCCQAQVECGNGVVQGKQAGHQQGGSPANDYFTSVHVAALASQVFPYLSLYFNQILEPSYFDTVIFF